MTVFNIYVCIYLAYRIKENGQERTEIEEDGVLKSVLINGKLTLCTVILSQNIKMALSQTTKSNKFT